MHVYRGGLGGGSLPPLNASCLLVRRDSSRPEQTARRVMSEPGESERELVVRPHNTASQRDVLRQLRGWSFVARRSCPRVPSCQT